jgi:hypothetical protein
VGYEIIGWVGMVWDEDMGEMDGNWGGRCNPIHSLLMGEIGMERKQKESNAIHPFIACPQVRASLPS